MKNIKSVGIIGAGALGLLYMERISSWLGDEAFFLATEERCHTINATEYSINGQSRSFKALNPLELEVEADLIILAVKNYHMDDIRPLLVTASGPGTIILSVLNGISSEQMIKEECPESTVLYAAALGMDAVKVQNTLNFSTPGKIIVGEERNRRTPELDSCTALFEECGIAYSVPEDIHRELWFKWMINIGVNQVSAVTGAPYGSFQTDPVLQDLMNRAMLETVALAAEEKINLTESSLKTWYTVLHTLGADGKTSMLQDIEAGRETEVDSFAGELIRRARKKGISVPVNETLYAIIKTKESLY
ncbi:MAG: ketopantoate reductase family protein [Spirochaetales bacterium]|nr:ketopantoate reductase family protein [Spirochaetales bacterium]